MQILIKGIKTNYIEAGEGDSILLLHGWGSNIGLFQQLIGHLSRAHRVFALDMPGFGETEEPKEPWCVDDYVDFVREFLSVMGIKKTSLLGHSFGGRVIIKMVTGGKSPAEFTKLVLVDSAGILPKKSMKQKFKTRLYKIGRKILSIGVVKKLYPDALENYRRSHGSADYNSATPVMRQTLVKVVNEDLEPLLSSIKQPVLLIWGDMDTATPLSDARIMEDRIKDSGLVVVKGAGHYSYLEQPDFVCRVLDSYFSA